MEQDYFSSKHYRGDFHVVYTARDASGSVGRCEFDVFVAPNECTVPDYDNNELGIMSGKIPMGSCCNQLFTGLWRTPSPVKSAVTILRKSHARTSNSHCPAHNSTHAMQWWGKLSGYRRDRGINTMPRRIEQPWKPMESKLQGQWHRSLAAPVLTLPVCGATDVPLQTVGYHTIWKYLKFENWLQKKNLKKKCENQNCRFKAVPLTMRRQIAQSFSKIYWMTLRGM